MCTFRDRRPVDLLHGPWRLCVPSRSGGEIAVGLAITAVQSFNTINDTVKSYIDNSVVKALHSGTGAVTLLAATPPTSQIEANGIAVSVGGGLSPEGAGFAGGGAGATNQITNTVKAYIAHLAHVNATALVSVTTTDNAKIDSSVGAYAVAFGAVGASIGASIQTSTVNNTVSAHQRTRECHERQHHGDLELNRERGRYGGRDIGRRWRRGIRRLGR